MYQDLEDDDDQNQIQDTGLQSHYQESNFKLGGLDDDFYEEEEALSENARFLAIHQIKTSDTRVFDGSSTSFGTIQSISSLSGSIQFSVAGPAAGSARGPVAELSIFPGETMHPPAVPQFQDKRRAFQKFKKQRTDGGGFNPVMPNKVDHTPAGFRFQKHAADEDRTSNYILDVEDQKTPRSYKSRAKRSQPPSANPHDAKYDPLNFILGHTKGQVARTAQTNLMTENLYDLDSSQANIASITPTGPSSMALSTDGWRPLYPTSESSLKATNYGGRHSANESQTDRLFQNESGYRDAMSCKLSADIDETIRQNFVSEVEVITHQARKTQFQRQNSEWSNIAALQGGFKMANVYVNHFSNDNVVRTEVAAETRLLNWDQYGNYRGEHQGSVKKRIRLWVIEQYKWWDAEMKAASDAYRELMEMRPAERMSAINATRMPITHWADGSCAAARDVFEQDELPAIYKKKWDTQRARLERLERMAEEPAEAAFRKTSRSEASQHTNKTVSIHGELGDMDGPLKSTPATQHSTHGVGKTRNSKRHVYALAERAIRAKSTRQSRTLDSSQRQGANRAAHDNGSTITPSSGRGVSVGSFSGGSGYSVAGTLSVASQDKYPPFGSRPSHPHNRRMGSRQDSNFGRATSSSVTNRGVNNTNSIRTDIAGAELLEFDDSPIFRDLSDVPLPFDGLNDLHFEQMMLAENQSSTRGRVVVVRLHATVEFSGEAIAKRVFGGIVQEFQLHPEQKMAVVIFVHPIEARAFLRHVKNVRMNGTEQEIRELQIEAAFYSGKEEESIQQYQKHIMSYHVGAGASRTLKIHSIPSTRSYRNVAADLSNRLGKLVLWMKFESPKGHLTLTTEGRCALVEFASVADAIEAYLMLSSGLEAGYENCKPEFGRERSEKPAFDKPYCDCLGCHERREKYVMDTAAKIQELRAQLDNHLSPLSSAARMGSAFATPQPTSVVASLGHWNSGSAAPGEVSHRAPSATTSSVPACVQGETTAAESENIIEFESDVGNGDEDWD